MSTASVISGNLRGGNQPVGGSTVSLWAAGTTGYGRQATKFSETTSLGSDGSFSFQQLSVDPTNWPDGIHGFDGDGGATPDAYACPTDSDPQMYIIAKGGFTQGIDKPGNSNAAFIVALGKCSTIGPIFVNMNEITTVATLAALQQYFEPTTEALSYPNTVQAIQGFANGVATIANLANTGTGTAIASKTLTGTAGTVNRTTVTVTPETAKINTFANVLAACINTGSSPGAVSNECMNLFTYAVPPDPTVTSQPGHGSYGQTIDTVQAAYYMLTNPTNGDPATLGKLYALGTPSAPFQPTLSSAPSDWTIGVLYLAGSKVGSGNTPNSCTGAASTGAFISSPNLIRADASGNLWMASNQASSSGSTVGVSELSPTGLPLGCVTFGDSQGFFQGLTIDTAGNIWAAAHVSGGGIYKIDPSTLATTTWTESGVEPWDIQADGSGNVFYTSASAPIHKFTGAATAVVPAASTLIGTAANANPNYMVLDPAGNIYVADNLSNNLYETYLDADGTNGYSTYTAGTSGSVQGQIAVDGAGKIWTTQTSPANTATVFTPATAPALAASSATTGSLGGLTAPRGVAIDGAGNAWIANDLGSSITELDRNANSLSSTTGFVKPLFSQNMRAVTVDTSGNVWIADNVTGQSVIHEIVGAGVPVVTPLSAQLASGTVAKPDLTF